MGKKEGLEAERGFRGAGWTGKGDRSRTGESTGSAIGLFDSSVPRGG